MLLDLSLLCLFIGQGLFLRPSPGQGVLLLVSLEILAKFFLHHLVEQAEMNLVVARLDHRGRPGTLARVRQRLRFNQRGVQLGRVGALGGVLELLPLAR